MHNTATARPTTSAELATAAAPPAARPPTATSATAVQVTSTTTAVTPAGDLPEIDALFDTYRDLVIRVARRVTLSAGGAQEVCQDVFLRVWRRGGFDPSRGSPEAWLTTVTQYSAIDWLRRETAERRRVEKSGPALAEVPISAEDIAMERERAKAVRDAVANLPTSERMAISMAYFGGLTYRQVAERLGLPEGTVKSRIRGGLTRLAQAIGPTARVAI